jgi:hypothetical protein
MRTPNSLLAILSLVAAAGCQDTAGPGSKPLFSVGGGASFSVLHADLRAFPPSPVSPPVSSAWGDLIVKVGYPPNPFSPSRIPSGDCVYPPSPVIPDMTPLLICGQLHVHNPAGELFTGSALVLNVIGVPPDLRPVIATFTGAYPPNPIRDCSVAIIWQLPAVIATDLATNPSRYSILFQSAGTMGIGGMLDGVAAGGAKPDQVYPPSPLLPPSPCSVQIGF